MSMTVQKLMTERLVTINQTATIDDACKLLLRHHIGGLPVVDHQNHLVGMLTERDLIGLLREPDCSHSCVDVYVTRDVNTLQPTDSVLVALDQFEQRGYRRMPVVDEHNVVVGILARRDFIRFIHEVRQRLGDRLDSIEQRQPESLAK